MDLHRIRQYIMDNPKNWGKDENYLWDNFMILDKINIDIFYVLKSEEWNYENKTINVRHFYN